MIVHSSTMISSLCIHQCVCDWFIVHSWNIQSVHRTFFDSSYIHRVHRTVHRSFNQFIVHSSTLISLSYSSSYIQSDIQSVHRTFIDTEQFIVQSLASINVYQCVSDCSSLYFPTSSLFVHQFIVHSSTLISSSCI